MEIINDNSERYSSVKIFLGPRASQCYHKKRGKNLSCQSLTSNIRLLQKHFENKELQLNSSGFENNKSEIHIHQNKKKKKKRKPCSLSSDHSPPRES